MVRQTDVDPVLIAHMRQEIAPLLSLLENYSQIQVEPRILLLRNPSISPSTYDAWRNDHRFGRITCPSSLHQPWPPGGAIDKACRMDEDDGLLCASAMVIWYSTAKDKVSYHKDPMAYERIASLTLEGEGVMMVRRGNKPLAHALQPGTMVVLDRDDCQTAKHSCVVSSHRLGLVLRYVSRFE